jgi:hypothetical protein
LLIDWHPSRFSSPRETGIKIDACLQSFSTTLSNLIESSWD